VRHWQDQIETRARPRDVGKTSLRRGQEQCERLARPNLGLVQEQCETLLARPVWDVGKAGLRRGQEQCETWARPMWDIVKTRVRHAAV
jgi:hypothetical protein